MRIGGVSRIASSLACVRILVSFLPLSTLTSEVVAAGVLADDHAAVEPPIPVRSSSDRWSSRFHMAVGHGFALVGRDRTPLTCRVIFSAVLAP